MSYSQAVEQQLRLMREMHGSDMGHYARATFTEDAAQAYLQHAHDALETADPYYWAPGICSVIDGVWRDMPTWTLRREALESGIGFFWFARPFTVPCPSSVSAGHQDQLVGLLWWIDETLVAPSDDHDEPVAWIYPVVTDGGSLTPYTGHTIPWFIGWDRDHVLRQWGDGEPLTDHNDAVTRIFSACLAFIEQRILTSRRESTSRATRKRAERMLLRDPLVRVVELRRKQVAGYHDGEHTAVDWACQWVVSGHWRQQWYPRLNAYQPRWIMPYVKGPEDKPLKPPRAKVFAVVR